MPSTQAASHGAGQTRPVNSGKLFVACSRSLRLAPLIAIHQVVPVGNDVSQRAAGVAKRNAAVHAARALRLQLLRRQDLEEFVVVLQSLCQPAPWARSCGRYFMNPRTSPMSHLEPAWLHCLGFLFAVS